MPYLLIVKKLQEDKIQTLLIYCFICFPSWGIPFHQHWYWSAKYSAN